MHFSLIREFHALVIVAMFVVLCSLFSVALLLPVHLRHMLYMCIICSCEFFGLQNALHSVLFVLRIVFVCLSYVVLSLQK